jgi:hypothetical protein
MSKRTLTLVIAILMTLPAGMALADNGELTAEDIVQAPQVVEEGILFYIPGPCCSKTSDCPVVSGYTVACGGWYCDGKSTCMYRSSTTNLDLEVIK